jgi:cell division protein FtsI (penicillin-binding protein 3)
MKDVFSRPFRLLSQQLGSWRHAAQREEQVEMAQNRTLVAGAMFALGFLVIAGRLAEVMLLSGDHQSAVNPLIAQTSGSHSRGDIIDRNGDILATHLVTASVYANPKVILDPEEAARKLCKALPDLNYPVVLKKLKSKRGFIWISRHIPPKSQHDVNYLGIPGVYLMKDERRVYPYGPLTSHVVGYCGIDNDGLGGVERQFEARLKSDRDPLQLSLDVRVQHIVRDELDRAIRKFSAEGANAMVMKPTGEILAMVSLPDFDPNVNAITDKQSIFNRNTLGIYEPGSTFKVFNTAIALETGKASLGSIYDASAPLKVGRFSIKDFKGKHRPLSVKEVFIYSSNIGSAKMALHFGGHTQKSYLSRFGMLNAPHIELPEVGAPLVPREWKEVTTMTVAYGYGIAVSPLQLMVGIGGVINGGQMRPATLLKRSPETVTAAQNVLSAETSAKIRDLMRLVVTEGTAKLANVPGYEVIGKTGTAHKKQGRGYSENAKITDFIGAFPKDNPQYIVVVFLDNPKPTKETYGYATGGWTAAPTAGRIISRIAPLLGVIPAAPPEGTGGMVTLEFASALQPESEIDSDD